MPDGPIVPGGSDWSTEVALRDGEHITMRPIRPDDKPLLAEAFDRLSPESRYLRFFSPMDRLSANLLQYFTEIDYDRHYAIGALRRDGHTDVGLGVARYVRLSDVPGAAEAAVAVTDDAAGRGIGTRLLEALTLVAREHGVDEFHLLVKNSNRPMAELIERLGATTGRDDDPSATRFVLDVPTLADDLAGTMMYDVLRAVAEGRVEPDPLRPLT